MSDQTIKLTHEGKDYEIDLSAMREVAREPALFSAKCTGGVQLQEAVCNTLYIWSTGRYHGRSVGLSRADNPLLLFGDEVRDLRDTLTAFLEGK